jgi:two-component system nitrogen regulation response regulator GlnG
LRHRRDDFGRLFKHFLCQELETIGESHRLEAWGSEQETRDGPTAWLDAATVARLAAYDWPGNVRQLRNVTRQLVISSRGERRARLPEAVEMLLAAGRPETSGGLDPAEDAPAEGLAVPRKPSEITDDDLVELLRAHRFNLRAAAAAAGISRTSLYALIESCPLLRKPADLGRDEITAMLERVGGEVDAAAAELEVSSLGLKRRLKSLGIR